MTLSGKGRRLKGHNFEREIAKIFRKYFEDARRNHQSRNHIDLNSDVEVPYFFIECKKGKKTNIKAALKQAETKRKDTDDRMALAICKDDYQKEIVSLRLDDFLKLLDMIFLDKELTK